MIAANPILSVFSIIINLMLDSFNQRSFNIKIRSLCTTPNSVHRFTHHAPSKTDANTIEPKLGVSNTMDKGQKLSLFKNERLRTLLSGEQLAKDSDTIIIKAVNEKTNLLFLPIIGVTSHKIIPKSKSALVSRTRDSLGNKLSHIRRKFYFGAGL